MTISNISKSEDFSEEDEVVWEGTGYSSLFGTECLVYFSAEELTVGEVEQYFDKCLNHLSKEMTDKIRNLSDLWRKEEMEDYPDKDYPEGLSEATPENILNFVHLISVTVYRNPYDSSDPQLGASIYCIPDWDEENHMEIVVKGNEVLEVREFLGYGEFAIWDKENG